MQVIFHIDMNAFFASCEVNMHPEYQGKPLIVAGTSRRGIVSTASYEARRYGIHSAMPTYQAIEKCPNVIVTEPHFAMYKKISNEFFAIIATYSNLIEVASIDECYVDMTHCVANFGGIVQTAQCIQQEVFEKLHIPCSIGISPNKFLSKMASDMKKPMGITVITKSNLKQTLWPLPIEDMYGIGKKTAPKLKEIGIQTIGDLANPKNYDKAKTVLGKSMLIHYQHAHGVDFSKVEIRNHEAKSIGHSSTLEHDTNDEEKIKDLLTKLAKQVSERAKKQHLVGNNVSLTLKYTRSESVVRSLTLLEYSNDYETLISAIMSLFEMHYHGRPIRLAGVSLNNTINEAHRVKQLSIFTYQEEHANPKSTMETLLEELNQKHKQAFIRASDLKNK